MTSDCFDIQNQLADYADNKLDEATLQKVRAHLNTCESCSLFMLEMQYTLSLCRDFPELEPPSALLERILDLTTGNYQILSWKDYLRELFHPLYASPRVATGTLLAAISVSMVFNALGVNLSHLTLNDLTPRNLMEKFDQVINIAYDSGLRRLNDLKILYQIQSRLEELSSQSKEESSTPSKQDKTNEGSRLLEDSSSHSLIVENTDHVGDLNL